MENQTTPPPVPANPTTPPIGTQTQTPPISQPKKGIPKLAIFAVVVFVVLAAIISAVFAFKDQLGNLVEKPTPTPAPQVVAPSPTPDPTANWQTYTNSELGFSLKYPDNLQVYDSVSMPECKEALSGPTFARVVVGKLTPDLVENCIYTGHSSPDGFQISTFPADPNNPLPKTNANDSYKSINLAGENGVINFTTETSEGPRGLNTFIFVDHNGVRHKIEFPNTDYKGTHDKVYDQILSTFKFLETTVTPEVSPSQSTPSAN